MPVDAKPGHTAIIKAGTKLKPVSRDELLRYTEQDPKGAEELVRYVDQLRHGKDTYGPRI